MYTNGPNISFPSGETAAKFLLGRWSSSDGKIYKCTAGLRPHGSINSDVLDLTRQPSVSMRLLGDPGIFTVVANGVIAVGDRIYPADAGKVGTTPTGYCLGVALVAAAADGDEIQALIDIRREGGLLYASQAASTNLASLSAETNFDKYFTLPANTLRAGDILRVRAAGLNVTFNSTNTMLKKLKLGTTTMLAMPAVTGSSGDIWSFEGLFQVRSIGATGKIFPFGSYGNGVADTATMKPVQSTEQTVDTTAALAVAVSDTHSASSASNVSNLQALAVELLRL